MAEKVTLDDLAASMNRHFGSINDQLMKSDTHIHEVKDTLADHGHRIDRHDERLEAVEFFVGDQVDKRRRIVARFEITVALVETRPVAVEEKLDEQPPKRGERVSRW